MKAIVLINAAPGFEDPVEAALDDLDAVLSQTPENQGNYDIAALLEGEDANEIQDAMNALRHESGIQGLQVVESPDDDLLARLKPS